MPAKAATPAGAGAGGRGTVTGSGFDRRLCSDFGEHLARQCQIDRTRRGCAGNRQGAVQNIFDIQSAAQFIVPLHNFAEHASLIIHLLRPVDCPGSRSQLTLLVKRRPSCHEQHGNFVALGVHHRADGIRRPDADMHHHRLRLAGDHGMAMRHANDEIFVRTDDRRRKIEVGKMLAGIGFGYRCRIRACVDEEIVDALLLQQSQKCLGHRNRFWRDILLLGEGVAAHGVQAFCWFVATLGRCLMIGKPQRGVARSSADRSAIVRLPVRPIVRRISVFKISSACSTPGCPAAASP